MMKSDLLGNAIDDGEQQQHDNIIQSVTDLPIDLLSEHIFAFVGSHQYRFVGGVCTRFNTAYGTKYPEKTTKYNLSSILHAKISYEEAPSEDKPLLNRRAKDQPWYYYVQCQDIHDMELLLWAKSTLGCPYTICMVASTDHVETCAMAAKQGDLEVLQWARRNGCPWDASTGSFAAKIGDFVGDVCTRFNAAYFTKYPEKTTNYNLSSVQHAKISYEEAPSKDHPFLKRRAMDQPWYYYVRSQDIHDIEILLWAKSTLGCPYTICMVAATTDAQTCAMAAKQGDLEMLQWARRNGCPWNASTCSFAAKIGDLEMLQWAHQNGCPWNTVTCAFAAGNGHLEVLQWAHLNGCPWDAHTCSYAAENGHLKVLQWAHANGCPWTADTCTMAAAKGQLEVLQWAHANGCPWDKITCVLAAENGHLEVLQWAHANGCPWDANTCSSAAGGGHFEMLQWACLNGCPWDARTCSFAAGSGHLEILQWAHANGCPWDEHTCSNAAYRGHLEVLQWAHANGCPWNEFTCSNAAENGHFEIFQWALSNGCPWNEENGLY